MTYVGTLCHICNFAVYVLYAMIYECNFAIGHNPWNNESLLTPVASIMCYVTHIQDVSEIRVLILTSERTRQIIELFSITFLRKSNTN
jgi:hypothetical protein